MIRNLFTKHDHRAFKGMTKEQAAQAASWFWRSRQFGINFTSAYSLQGAQYHSRLGLRQAVNVYVVDESDSVGVDLSFSADLTDEGAIVGAIGAVLVLPVAVAVGAVSYIEYENDAIRQMNDFWGYMHSFPSNPQPPAAPASAPSWAQQGGPQTAAAAGSPPAPRVCPGCNAPQEADAKFCKYCGNKL